MEGKYHYRKTIIFLLLFIIVLAWWIGTSSLEAWHSYQWQKKTDAFMELGRKPYKEDTYGGKTPEETWAMFLYALKTNDTELASRYFVVGKQAEEKKELNKIKIEGGLEPWLIELEKIEKDSNQTTANNSRYFSYKTYSKILKKEIWVPVIFILNPYTSIWKILVL